jgi:signal transduction histidine kinase
MRSIKARLIKVLFVVAVLFWASVVGFWIIFSMRQEFSHHDALFEGIAKQIVVSMPANVEQMPDTLRVAESAAASPTPEKVNYQVWVNRSRAVVRSPTTPLTPLNPDFTEGFSNQLHGEQMWRIYTVADATGKMHVQVGAMRSVIDAEVKDKATKMLFVASILLLLLGGAIWGVICWSLRPVEAVETAVRKKDVFDLTPLPTDNLPTEIKSLVLAFNSLLARLGQAMEAERSFIADAAHELRTPLAALQAHGEVALRAGSMVEKDEALKKLLVVVERSTRLSEQLLDLAQLEAGTRAGHRQPIDLCELIPVVVRDFEAVAQHRQQSISVHTDACRIDGDIDQLGILVRNLVDNALRYSCEQGRVDVTCGSMERDGVAVGFLRVADDGPGVPKSEQAHIFDRFYRVPGNGGRGSGIGLSLVARIAEFHHARIEIGDGLDGRGLGVTIVFGRD